MNRDEIKDLLKQRQDGDYYEFQEKIVNDINKDVDIASVEYIKSGKAFDTYIKSDRFNEAKEDINDVAITYYKKFKGNEKAIQKELQKDGYDLKKISSIVKLIREM